MYSKNSYVYVYYFIVCSSNRPPPLLHSFNKITSIYFSAFEIIIKLHDVCRDSVVYIYICSPQVYSSVVEMVTHRVISWDHFFYVNCQWSINYRKTRKAFIIYISKRLDLLEFYREFIVRFIKI